MKILKYPNKKLRTVCKPVINFDSKLMEVGNKLLKLMVAHNGVGLAANQVGLKQKMFVSRLISGIMICNPSWEPTISGFDYTVAEGCLSFLGWLVPVKRYDAILAEWQDCHGVKIKTRLTGLVAQVFQHETNHLNSILMIDHLNPAQKKSIENQLTRSK